MKKKTTAVRAMGMLLGAGLLLGGCGSSMSTTAYSQESAEGAAAYDSSYDTGNIYTKSAAEENTTTTAVTEEAVVEEYDTTEESVQVSDTSRKLIRNVSLDVETEEFDTLLATVGEKTTDVGGYVESSFTYNGSYYYGDSNRNASLTLRIPAEQLNAFLSAVSEISNVTRQEESVTDVTLQYVDMASHKEALQTEQTRLLELLEQAESVEDIITIESRLSEVRYQIESMESQLRTMDNQVSYSTVYLYIEEVARYKPVKEQTTLEKITTGFADSLYQVMNGLKNFGIGLIIRIPYLILWAILILLIILIIKWAGKRRRRKQNPDAGKAGKRSKTAAAEGNETDRTEESKKSEKAEKAEDAKNAQETDSSNE